MTQPDRRRTKHQPVRGRDTDMTRIAITCEDCGRRHQLERPVAESGMLWIVCHDCELPLHAVFEGAAASSSSSPAAVLAPDAALPSRRFQDAWAGMLDLSSAAG
jgi:hypothetical protein